MNVPPAQRSGAAAGGDLDALGLEREPFSALLDEDFYYSETQRAKCLHFLLHLAPYSDVLLLTGERDSGKSSLIQQFIARASPSWRICAVDGALIKTPRALLEALSEVLLFDVVPSQEETLARLHKMLRTLRNSALVPVLIIDEAHRLPLPVLQLLARLVETATPEARQLCIILVGEHELEQRLLEDDLRALRARVGHSFDLPPFDEEETGKYIRHRLAVAGLGQTAIFTPARLRRIHEQSGGLPGRINHYAREMLLASLSPAHSDDDATTAAPARQGAPPLGAKRRPVWRRPLLGLLGLALAGVLLFQSRINQWLAPPPMAPVPAPPTRAVSPPQPLPQVRAPQPGPAQGGQDQSQDQSQDQQQDQPPRQPAASAVVADARPPAVPEVSPPSPKAPSPEKDGPAPPAATAGEAGADSAPPPAASAGPPPASPLRGGEWLRSRDPRHYTLQLLAMSKARVAALISGWGLEDEREVATFPTGQERRLLALVYGDYEDRGAAQAAAAELRRRFPGTRPWPRSFAAIQRLLGVAQPQPSPDDAPGRAEAVGAARLAADEARILALDGARYTLQLMAMDLAAVERRIASWGMASEVLYYRTLRGDRELVAVIHGDFADAAAAREAARRLRRRIPGIDPWVRRVAAVHNAIHAFRAIHR